MSSLKKQGAVAFTWDFLGKLFNRGMGFIVSIFLARLLEPSDFGTIALILVIIGIADIFTDLGLGGALIQRKRVSNTHYSSVFYLNVLVGLLFTLLFFVLAPTLSGFFGNQNMSLLIQVVSISFFINALASIHTTKLRKDLNYSILTKIRLVASIISGIIGVLMAFYGAGIWSLVAQSLVSQLLYMILIWNVSSLSIGTVFSIKALKQLWTYGFRMFLAGVLDNVFSRLNILIIGKLFPLATLGYLQRAKSLNDLAVQYSSGSLMSVLFPILSKIQDDLERFKKVVFKSLSIISFMVFLLTGILYLNADSLIELVYGKKWLPASEYFKIIALSSFLYPVSSILVNVLSSRGNSKMFLRLEIYKKALSVITLIVLFVYGVNAYLYALLIIGSIAVYLNIYFVHQEIEIKKWFMIKIILIQALIAWSSVFILLELNMVIKLEGLLFIIVNSSAYTILFVGMNKLFQTQSYDYVMEEGRPLISKVSMKLRKY